MKKLALLTVLLLVAAVKANADDIITKTNGEQIKAKVLEVGDNTVKFMRLDNPNGPTYFLNFSEIQSIAYENGFVENYSEPAPEPQHYYAERHDISYRDIANIYNPRAYVEQFDDPYSPAGAGVASFFIPGLGQCIDGEWGARNRNLCRASWIQPSGGDRISGITVCHLPAPTHSLAHLYVLP